MSMSNPMKRGYLRIVYPSSDYSVTILWKVRNKMATMGLKTRRLGRTLSYFISFIVHYSPGWALRWLCPKRYDAFKTGKFGQCEYNPNLSVGLLHATSWDSFSWSYSYPWRCVWFIPSSHQKKLRLRDKKSMRASCTYHSVGQTQ